MVFFISVICIRTLIRINNTPLKVPQQLQKTDYKKYCIKMVKPMMSPSSKAP